MLKLFFCDLWFCLCCCTCVFVSLTLAKVLSWQRKEVRRVKIVRRPSLTWLFSCLGSSLSYCCERFLSSKHWGWPYPWLGTVMNWVLFWTYSILNSLRNIVVNASTIATTTSQQKVLDCLDTRHSLLETDVFTHTISPLTLICVFYDLIKWSPLMCVWQRISLQLLCCQPCVRNCSFHLLHNQLWLGKQFWQLTAVYTWLPLSKYSE